MTHFTYPRRKLFRVIRALMLEVFTLIVVPGVLTGCLGDTRRLPDPRIRRCDSPAWNDAQQARQNEANEYNYDQYKKMGWLILDTIETYNCDLIDCLDPKSVEGSQIMPRRLFSLEQMQLPEGVQLQLTEFDVFPELRCKRGMPMYRPQYLPYIAGDTAATSVKDFIENYQAVGAPDDPQRRYAGIIRVAGNHGAFTALNAFGGGVVEDRTMSVYEMVVGCRNGSGEMWQQVGIAMKRDGVNIHSKDWYKADDFSPSILRLDVELLTAGPKVLGGTHGGWDTMSHNQAFIPSEWRPYGPGTAVPSDKISTVGGKQYDALFNIYLWNGDWWVAHNGNWLGRYPGARFDAAPPNLLQSQACEVDWYLEMFAETPVPWPATEAGSSNFPEAGYGNAAYFRNPFYLGTEPVPEAAHWPDTYIDIPEKNNACYTKTPLTSGVTPMNRVFYADGPGRKNPGCK